MGQIQTYHNLILETGFVEIIRNTATNFFYCKKFAIADTLAFFYRAVATLKLTK